MAVLVLGFTIASLAVPVVADGAEDPDAVRAWLLAQVADARPNWEQEFQVQVPAGAMVQFTVDWASGRVEAGPGPGHPALAPPLPLPRLAGCINLGSTGGTVLTPSPPGIVGPAAPVPCNAGSHTGGITRSILTCGPTPAGVCELIMVQGTFWFWADAVIIRCASPGASVIDWAMPLAPTQVGCTVTSFGANPNPSTWGFWFGMLWKSGGQPAAGLHVR